MLYLLHIFVLGHAWIRGGEYLGRGNAGSGGGETYSVYRVRCRICHRRAEVCFDDGWGPTVFKWVDEVPDILMVTVIAMRLAFYGGIIAIAFYATVRFLT